AVADDNLNLGEHQLALEDNATQQRGAQDDHSHGSNHYNIFKSLERAEWDTLMFFYGIILCVGGLGTLGYLSLVSQMMYVDLGTTNANILVGFLSAIIDNIPVMFAVLAMMPDMSHGQWLLVTLTAGVGGSMLAIGSAAGVAVMGTARGVYTFMAHLKWSWAIALGYAASIWVHFLVNASAFSVPAGAAAKAVGAH
ncbi:MAG: sodium:proton antiporter NhaD, partial [Candidatus Thiodiazotropha lotti]